MKTLLNSKQWFRNENYFVEFSEQEMVVVERPEWKKEATGVDTYFFPRDWAVFFKLFRIGELKEISKEEFDKEYVLAKIIKNQNLLAA
jgi:hypothetical protein